MGADGPSEPTVLERPFPLWREPHRLPSVLAELAGNLGGSHSMAVTMTAELADCFNTKREGVAFVLDAFRTAFPETSPWVYGIDGRFRSADDARRRPLLVAAANWRASATLVARVFPDALFLDVGSTTTDVIPIVSGAGGGPWKDRSRPASHRRADLYGCAADARVRDRALRSSRESPVPGGCRAFSRSPPTCIGGSSGLTMVTTPAKRRMAAAGAAPRPARGSREWCAPISTC